MAGLGKTIERLQKARRASVGPGGAVAPFIETARFGKNPGALRMLSYVPLGVEPGAPLVVVLHGCSQTAAAHAQSAGWVTLAERYGFALIAPEQSPQNNPNRCFNWFEPEDIRRGKGEAASIRSMVDHAVARHDLDPRRVYVTGLSAGGAMTSVMLAAYPDVFAGGAVVAGLPHGVADNMQGAFGAMQGAARRSAIALGELVRQAAPAGSNPPRVSVWHGDADSTVRASNGEQVALQWADVHGLSESPSETLSSPGRTQRLWRAPDGEVLVEAHVVHGLGHGTPISTKGPEGLGSAAPFMLEAGVSAPLEIARFWGLAPAAAIQESQTVNSSVLEGELLGPEDEVAEPPAGVGAQVMAALSGHVDDKVGAIIAGALKSAGLLR
ncbi:MAG TPA: PHB depolymerase family esterase [Phenylobacterium sp.]